MMNRKPTAKASLKNLTKGNGSQHRLQPPVVGKSRSKKELPTFHSRSMIEYEQEEPREYRSSHQTSIVENTLKGKPNIVVALPQKNSACMRKSPVAKYVRKEPSCSFTSTNTLNLRSTLKNINRLEPTKESRDDNAEIILQLRETIEEMRLHEAKKEEDAQRLKRVNERLEQQNRELIETLKKHELRQRELCQKLRQAEGDSCVDHEIIIQSLKKVIDGQLHKIIELERQKIAAEGASLRGSRTADVLECGTHESTPSFPPSSPHPRLKEILQRVTQEVEGYASEDSDGSNDQNRPPPQQLDTFRKGSHNRKERHHDYRTDDILQEIDNCLDSLSRRKRQLM